MSNMQVLELEDGSAGSTQRDCRSRVFPLRPFRCCGPIFCWLPDTVKEIQDCTHLALVLGMVAMVAMVIQTIVSVVNNQLGIFSPKNFFAVREGITILLVTTVSPYCWGIIQQYDQRLTDKQADCRAAKEELSKRYADLCSEMHDTLDKFAEYTGAYAQNIFEGKYRSFGHWAKQVAQSLEQESKMASAKEKAELKEEFRKMCMNWFRVLAECGINPADKPVILCKKEELDCLDSFMDIARKVQERCTPPKISVVEKKQNRSGLWTSHMKGKCENCQNLYSPAQASEMKGTCKTCTRGVIGMTYWLDEIPAWNSKRPGTCENCKEWYSPDQAYECDGVCPKCHFDLLELKPVTQELQQQQQAFKKDATHAKAQAKRFSGGASALGLSSASARGLLLSPRPARSRGRCCPCAPPWMYCSPGCSCGRVLSEKPGGWPVTYTFCCLTMRVFSRDHIKLMSGFLLCLTLLGLNITLIILRDLDEKQNTEDLLEHNALFILRTVENFCIQVSLLCLLIRFEDIDIVQQLERETDELKEEKARVEHTNETVQQTFGMLQKMNVVWLNRTIPRLDLMNEVSNRLCDVDQQTSKSEWIMANQAIADLERKIGSLQDWIHEDKVAETDKKRFEKMIKSVYQENTLTDMIATLKGVNAEQLGFLQALEPPKEDKPMVDIQMITSAPAPPAGRTSVYVSHHASEAPQLDV